MKAAGMRYQALKDLIGQLEEKKKSLSDLMMTIKEDRVKEIASVYGGVAADSFKNRMIKTANDVDSSIAEIIAKLNEKAEVEGQDYQRQEEELAISN